MIRSRSRRPSRSCRRGSASARARRCSMQPSGASDGSSRLCSVTRIDGSGMRTPSSISALNEPSQSWPKWMLWCAASAGGRPLDPGDPQQARRRVLARARRPRCLDVAEQLAVGDREIGVAHHGVGLDALGALDRRPAGRRATEPSPWRRMWVDRRRVADRDAGLLDRVGEPGGHLVHAALGHEHALDRVHVGDDRVERQRLVRGEAGVHRLEAEDPLQALVVEERGDLLAELAEPAELDEREPGPPRLDQVERRVEVGVDERAPSRRGRAARASRRTDRMPRPPWRWRTRGSPRSSPRARGARTASSRRRSTARYIGSTGLIVT